jgi:hypothetical protein
LNDLDDPEPKKACARSSLRLQTAIKTVFYGILREKETAFHVDERALPSQE